MRVLHLALLLKKHSFKDVLEDIDLLGKYLSLGGSVERRIAGLTPLHFLLNHRNNLDYERHVLMLLNFGADTAARNSLGYDAFEAFCSHKLPQGAYTDAYNLSQIELMRAFKPQSSQLRAFDFAVECGRVALVQEMLSWGWKCTPLALDLMIKTQNTEWIAQALKRFDNIEQHVLDMSSSTKMSLEVQNIINTFIEQKILDNGVVCIDNRDDITKDISIVGDDSSTDKNAQSINATIITGHHSKPAFKI